MSSALGGAFLLSNITFVIWYTEGIGGKMFTIILLFGFLGLLLQRVSGTGFALVMVPVYTLFLGPVQGLWSAIF